MFDVATGGPPIRSDRTDLDDSLDIRLIVAGLMSPTTIPVRRDRAELARVLARPSASEAGERDDSKPRRASRSGSPTTFPGIATAIARTGAGSGSK